jgi:hypothetical protein
MDGRTAGRGNTGRRVTHGHPYGGLAIRAGFIILGGAIRAHDKWNLSELWSHLVLMPLQSSLQSRRPRKKRLFRAYFLSWRKVSRAGARHTI